MNKKLFLVLVLVMAILVTGAWVLAAKRPATTPTTRIKLAPDDMNQAETPAKAPGLPGLKPAAIKDQKSAIVETGRKARGGGAMPVEGLLPEKPDKLLDVCDFMGEEAWYNPGWLWGDEHFCNFQDPSFGYTYCPYTDVFPMQVEGIFWELCVTIGAPVEIDWQGFIYANVGTDCPYPGAVICSTLVTHAVLDPAGCYYLSAELTQPCCVYEPYFAGVYLATDVTANGATPVWGTDGLVCQSYYQYDATGTWEDLVDIYGWDGMVFVNSWGNTRLQNDCVEQPICCQFTDHCSELTPTACLAAGGTPCPFNDARYECVGSTCKLPWEGDTCTADLICPPTVRVLAGESAEYDVTVGFTGAFPQCYLTTVPDPVCPDCDVSVLVPNPVPNGQTQSTLTIQTAATTPVGVYTFQINSGTPPKASTATLEVVAPTDQCEMFRDTEAWAYYWGTVNEGDMLAVYFDPEAMCPSCGENVYPFQVTDVKAMFYDRLNPVGGNFTVHIYSATSDPCAGPQDELLSWDIVGTTEWVWETIPVPETLCVSGPFFIALEHYTTPDGQPYTILIEDAPECPMPECVQWWFDAGVWAPWEETGLSTTGYLSLRALGVGASPDCPGPPVGCCQLAGSCAEMTEADCQTAGGVWAGEGATCVGNYCEETGVGCCQISDVCFPMGQAACQFVGGSFSAPPAACVGNLCVSPGAGCCQFTGSCADMGAGACAAAGGTWTAPPATCVGIACYTPPIQCDTLQYTHGVPLNTYRRPGSAYNQYYTNERFTAPLPGKVGKARVLFYNRVGTPDAAISLWTDDGTGLPAVQLCSVYVAPPVPISPTWCTVDFTPFNASFAEGEEFHVGFTCPNFIRATPTNQLRLYADAGGYLSDRLSEYLGDFGFWGAFITTYSGAPDIDAFIQAELCYDQPEFELAVDPTSQEINWLQTTSYAVSLKSILGFNDPVTLTVTGFPPSAGTATFTVNPVTPSGTSQLDIDPVDGPVAAGVYTLTITGQAGAYTHQKTVKLKINSPYNQETTVKFNHGFQRATNFGAVGNDALHNFVWYTDSTVLFDGSFVIATTDENHMAFDMYDCHYMNWLASGPITTSFSTQYNANVAYANFFTTEDAISCEYDSLFVVGIMDSCVDFSIKIKVYYNPTDVGIVHMYPALLEDWDVGDAYNDWGEMDPVHNLMYQYDPLEPNKVFGIMKAPFYDDAMYNMVFVSNPDYVWPNAGFCTGDGLSLLYGLISTPGYYNSATSDTDLSILMTAPPIDLPAHTGKHIEVWIDFGRDLNDGFSWETWYHRVLRYAGFYRGDVNSSDGLDTLDVGHLEITDAVTLIDYLFRNGPTPKPYADQGDVNCDRKVDVQDVVYLINYLFIGGPAPCDYVRFIPQMWSRTSLFENTNWR